MPDHKQKKVHVFSPLFTVLQPKNLGLASLDSYLFFRVTKIQSGLKPGLGVRLQLTSTAVLLESAKKDGPFFSRDGDTDYLFTMTLVWSTLSRDVRLDRCSTNTTRT